MPGQYGSNALEFVISTLVNLYVMIVLLRFLMQTFKVDFYNPISQFAVKLTSPLLKPIRRAVPGIAGIDVSSLLLAWGLLSAKSLLFKALGFQLIKIGGMGILLQNAGFGLLLYFSIIDIIAW